MRASAPLPDDPLIHACAVAYVSDLGSGFGQVEVPGLPAGGPSIDHSLWFHDPIRADEWMLLELWPLKASGSRGVYSGSLRSRDGRLGVLLTQEMLLRDHKLDDKMLRRIAEYLGVTPEYARWASEEQFRVETILAEAGRRTGGLDDLGDGPFVEPLALFLESLEREARLNEIGRLIASERALGHTVNRLNYVNDRKQFPEIADEKIVRAGVHHRLPPHRHDDPARHPRPGPRQSRAAHLGDDVPVAAAGGRDLRHRSAHRAARRRSCPTPETETERDRRSRRCTPWAQSSRRNA